MREFKEYGTHRCRGGWISGLFETYDQDICGVFGLQTHLEDSADDAPVDVAILLELLVHFHGELHIFGKGRRSQPITDKPVERPSSFLSVRWQRMSALLALRGEAASYKLPQTW